MTKEQPKLSDQLRTVQEALDIALKEIRAWRSGLNTRSALDDLNKAKVGCCYGGLLYAPESLALIPSMIEAAERLEQERQWRSSDNASLAKEIADLQEGREEDLRHYQHRLAELKEENQRLEAEAKPQMTLRRWLYERSPQAEALLREYDRQQTIREYHSKPGTRTTGNLKATPLSELGGKEGV